MFSRRFKVPPKENGGGEVGGHPFGIRHLGKSSSRREHSSHVERSDRTFNTSHNIAVSSRLQQRKTSQKKWAGSLSV
jgi:hypothetical protein